MKKIRKDPQAADRLRLAEMRELQPVDPRNQPAVNNRAQRRAQSARLRRGK